MKIRSKIALRYAGVTAVLLVLFASLVYFMSARDRENEFSHDLRREGVSKANLFFESRATPEVLHSIYTNNIEYIDEVEVAIYTMDYNLLYHDDVQIDIVKETPELFQIIVKANDVYSFYQGKYQAVGFIFKHHGIDYIVTAAAYDGYGYSKLNRLIINLLILSTLSIIALFFIGYILAKRALAPVADITDKIKGVMSNNLFPIVLPLNQKDEIGELAKQFNRALTIIEESYESQKEFISNVSHELRTPLATLIGEIDVALLKDRNTEEYKQILLNSKEDTNQLIELINDLLDLARANYDNREISMTEIRVDELLLDARENIIRSNPAYSVILQFNYEIEDDSDICVIANEYLLRRAFINLIENNCKYSDNHTSVVSISIINKLIQIEFSDNGLGMSDKDLKNIYTPFFRGSNKDFCLGNGIGMTFVKKVVDLHECNISIQSQVDIGTIFTVRL